MIQIQYLDGRPPGNEHGLAGDSKFCRFFTQISQFWDQYQTHNSTKKRLDKGMGTTFLPRSFITMRGY